MFSDSINKMPARRAYRKRGRKGPGARKNRRMAKRAKSSNGMNDGGQFAKIKETIAFQDLNPNLSVGYVFNLSQFRRASQLAPNFKFYKATHVEWSYEPLYNTFQDGTTGGEVTLPYMYTTMNRTQDATILNLTDLQEMGAKPQKLNNKKVIKYRPNWCSPGLQQMALFTSASPTGKTVAEVDSAGLRTQYEWLQCPNKDTGVDNDPQFTIPLIANNNGTVPGITLANSAIITNQVIYNGHNLFVDQLVPTGVLQPIARVTCTVHWHFKGPHKVGSSQPIKEAIIAQPM